MFDRYVALRAQQMPHAIAVSTPQGDLSYAKLDGDAGRIAASLAEVPRPALASVRVADPYVHMLVLLALSRLGIAMTSISAGQDAALIGLLSPDLMIADGPAPEDFPAKNLRWLAITQAWLDAALRRPAGIAARTRPTPDPDALGLLLTSSGTTGLPKKVALSWRELEARLVQTHLAQSQMGSLARVLCPLGPGSGAFFIAIPTWHQGGTMIFASPNPVALAAALPSLRPTGMVLAPVQMSAILDALPANSLPMRDLWVCMVGSHTPAAVSRAVRLRLTGDIYVGLGSTEAGAISGAPLAALGDDPAAVGFVMPWATVEVVDEAHEPVPPGSLGQIRVKGPHVVSGYLDAPEVTAERFRDGWFYPGDLGTLGANGALRIEGRSDEVMNFGGEKMLPRAMEDAALNCPGVRDAAAFSLPDASGLPAPWLAIVRGEALDPVRLDRTLRDGLPTLPPIRVAWIDAIPRNQRGKVDRERLRRAASALPVAEAPKPLPPLTWLHE